MPNKFTPLLICILFIAARPAGFKSENKEITKTYVHVPAKDANHKGFYISSIEITNKQYRDFLNDLKAKGQTDKLKRAMIDTSIHKSFLGNTQPFISDYFYSHAKDAYPVVNVSEEGAVLYCEWLTEKYNATAKVKVHFALPDEEQWIWAAKGGDAQAIYPWKGNSLKGTSKNLDMCNYKHQASTGKPITDNPSADVTAPSVSFMPNGYGIYNMSGNVAEMLASASYTKGGSWMSGSDQVTITAREDYPDHPGSRPNVGFRPIMITPDGE